MHIVSGYTMENLSPEERVMVDICINENDSVWILKGKGTYSRRNTIMGLGGKWNQITREWSIQKDTIQLNDLMAITSMQIPVTGIDMMMGSNKDGHAFLAIPV